MHLGLIGGIGPAATIHYYRGLSRRHAAAGTALDLTIVNADVRDLARNIASGDAAAQVAAFLPLLQRLEAAGATAAAVTSMGGHFCIAELAARSSLPLINAIPEVGAEIRRRGLRKVGLLGTGLVMRTRLYSELAAESVVVPRGAMFDETGDSYAAMARAGEASEAQREVFFAAGRELVERQGAEAVILGGTDLFLAFEGRDCGFPTIDSAEIHIEALYRRSRA